MSPISKNFYNINLEECTFLGKGCEGKVYETPDGLALKVFKNQKKCKAEYHILKTVSSSNYFPKVIAVTHNYMLREMARGLTFDEYIKQNGISKKLVVNIINLIKDLRSNGFKRLDPSCRHIFVESDDKIKLIDPRKPFTKNQPSPKHILKALEKQMLLDEFMKLAVEEDLDEVSKWFNPE